MKFKTWQTIRIGFAFLSICAFWQMYNNIVPVILTRTFHLGETLTGVIMAADNVLALFLLPIFGALSDKCKSKMGRRKPFILFGTIAAVVLMVLIPLIDNSYYNDPSTGKAVLFIAVLGALLVAMGTYRSPAVALMPDLTPKPYRSQGNAIINLMGAIGGIIYLGLAAVLYPNAVSDSQKAAEKINDSALTTISEIDKQMVAIQDGALKADDALKAAADQATSGLESSKSILEAVSEKAQEVIATIEHVDYTLIFLIVAGIMLLSMVIVMTTINERKLLAEVEEYEAAHPEEDLTVDDGSGEAVLPPEVKRSLIFLLASVALWFVSYNAVETWFTVFAEETWGKGIGGASTCLLVANAGAIISYIPVGIIAGKIGRKKSILIGIIMMAACYIFGLVYTSAYGEFSSLLYVVFAIIGMGWAAINVNSLPMVLEMCKGSDVGKFTGYYYTFSMAAQIVTPILCGYLLENIGYGVYFIYAAVFMILAFITMIFVKHGDSKNIKVKKGLEAFEDMD